MRKSSEKIFKDSHKLKEVLDKEKASGKKVVFTNGCYDLLHIGHIRLLQEAKKHGDILVVALNSDTSLLDLKGDSRGILNEDERCKVIAALESVDYVCIFSDPTPQQIVNLLRPNVLIKGGDYKVQEIVGRETVWEEGGEVIPVPLVEGFSTTNIINRILERYN